MESLNDTQREILARLDRGEEIQYHPQSRYGGETQVLRDLGLAMLGDIGLGESLELIMRRYHAMVRLLSYQRPQPVGSCSKMICPGTSRLD